MADTVTELTIDASGAERGAEVYQQAMDKASRAANDNLRAIADNTTAMRRSMDGLGDASRAANDNTRGFGLELGVVANHLRQAGEAAYAFSPAFRGVVNEMAVPALKAAASAVEAVASGLVTATNVAGTGVIWLGERVAQVAPRFPGLATAVKGAGEAMAAFSPTVAGAAASVLSFLAPGLRLLGWLALAKTAIDLVREAWRLGGEEIERNRQIAEKAAAVALPTESLQRYSKAAEDTKLPIDALAASFKRLNEATADQLGGTAAQKRLEELVKAGNFQGNAGVSDLARASTTEEKFQAVVRLIDEAMQKGERLAALDVSKNFLGDEVTQRLAKDSGYLDRLVAKTAEVKPVDIVSDAEISRAVDLENRLDAAEKILSQRWHPIQKALTELGVQMHEGWVNIVEKIAAAVDWAAKLADKLSTIPAGFWTMLQSGSVWKTISEPYTNTPEKQSALKDQYGISFDQKDIAELDARNRLAAGLRNPATVAAARDQGMSLYSSFYKDASKDPAKKTDDTTAAYDRATESLLKYIKTTEAAAQTVEQSVYAQEHAKAMAQLLAAAEKDGTKVTADLRKEMEDLADRAAKAAEGLAKARVEASIKFETQTAFLTSEDVAIAQQLRTIYGSDVPAALASTEAAALRAVNGLKEISSVGQEVNRGLLVDFGTNLRNGASAWDSFKNAGVNALGKIADKLMSIAADNLWQSAFGGSTGGGLLGLLGLGGGSSSATMVSDLGAGTGGLSFPMFADGTDSAPGGWSIIGEKGPELMYVPKGAAITPNGQSPRTANDNGGSYAASVQVSIDARGADGAGLGRVQQQLEQLKADLPALIVQTHRDAKARRLIA